MIVVTGGAGFIGSNLVKALNNRGIEDILIVDHLKNSAKMENIRSLQFIDYQDKMRFLSRIERQAEELGHIEAIFHIGACSDTMEQDGAYMMDTNYEYSKILLHYCLKSSIPFHYASSASVYGSGASGFKENPTCESPLNVYAYSKFLFDNYVRHIRLAAEDQVVGLRYFNVYGPQEMHKQKMASIVWQLYMQLKTTGVARLFEGTDGYANGEQLRDFIYVKDVIRMHLYFFDHRGKSGIFNCGTGQAHSFNQVAQALINRMGKGCIEYIPFPNSLAGKYQSFTQADMTCLHEIGWDNSFTSLEDAIDDYCGYLDNTDGFLREWM